jgi:hypothetical protein
MKGWRWLVGGKEEKINAKMVLIENEEKKSFFFVFCEEKKTEKG